jgi:hypothetical protein
MLTQRLLHSVYPTGIALKIIMRVLRNIFNKDVNSVHQTKIAFKSV